MRAWTALVALAAVALAGCAQDLPDEEDLGEESVQMPVVSRVEPAEPEITKDPGTHHFTANCNAPGNPDGGLVMWNWSLTKEGQAFGGRSDEESDGREGQKTASFMMGPKGRYDLTVRCTDASGAASEAVAWAVTIR